MLSSANEIKRGGQCFVDTTIPAYRSPVSVNRSAHSAMTPGDATNQLLQIVVIFSRACVKKLHVD